MSIRSRHSVRTVLTQRSAKASARGNRTGILITRMPSERNTSSKLVVNLVSRSDQELDGSIAVGQVTHQVAGHLGDERTLRMDGDAEDVRLPTRQFDDEEHVELLQPPPCPR